MKKLKAALLGAGNRGQIYCDYALTCPDELEIVSVIDINPFKMNEAGDKYGINNGMRFLSLDEFIKANVECDFVVNATMDEMHYETAMKLIEAGYNLVLEKPITANLSELLDIERAAREKGVKILVCHVLRYTPFYRSIKEIIDSGKIGKVINMQLKVNVERIRRILLHVLLALQLHADAVGTSRRRGTVCVLPFLDDRQRAFLVVDDL